MIKNYFKVAWRNLLKSKGYSLINIGGLAVGMAVAMLIGLWIWDELSFNRYHANHERVAQVMQHQNFNGEVETQESNPAVTAGEIRKRFGSDFKHVLQASWNFDHTLAVGQKKLLKSGSFFEPGVTDMLTLSMLHGTRSGLKDPYSILLSRSVSVAFFGKENPVGKTIRIDNRYDVKVTGVYEDLPYNTSFRDLTYILPWQLYLIQNPWIEKMEDPWGSNFTRTFAQIADRANMQQVSAKIRKVKYDAGPEDVKRYNPMMFLHPMGDWHLRRDFKSGVNTGGRIQYVWLFGIIGIFVLLLACINFMNLSTARSEKRAKEVGIRKAVGSVRSQLIAQFFSESFLVVSIALLVSLLLVMLLLPFFNEVADKKLTLLWKNPVFWLMALSFSLLTGLIAGSYPALYLSSFQPVKVLKGTFQVGRYASLPRKVLVVLQFSVSIILIIGTLVVHRQIQHAKERAVGYNKESLVWVSTNETIHGKFEVIRNELKGKNLIVEMTESNSPATGVWNSNGGFEWEGKDPSLSVDFPNNAVTPEYGKVVGWKIVQGRDFSRSFASDTAAFVINESAVKFIGFKDPVGKMLKWNDRPYTIVGVISDMLVESPYEPVRASLFHVSKEQQNVVQLRIHPNLPPAKTLSQIESVFRKYDAASVFDFNFVDEEFDRKFGDEERIGKLATSFSVFAIFISCLGLFGLASFVAERRTKEIGIRKVIGASVFNVWKLLSTDFVILVIIACLVAVPLAWIGMNRWLQSYTYRTSISWWIFVAAVAGALIITILTISFQAVRAALANPVRSLRSE